MATYRLFGWRPLSELSSGWIWFAVAVSGAWGVFLWKQLIGDAWIISRWPRAEAILQGDPATWPPQRPPGGPLGDELKVVLPDGRVIEGRSVKPLRAWSGAPLYETRRMQPGDLVTVHVRADEPQSLAVRHELTVFSWPLWVFGGLMAFAFVQNLRELLRRRRQRDS